LQRAYSSVKFIVSITLLLLILTSYPLCAQQQTAGLFIYDSASFTGYTLFAPTGATKTFLIDNYGRLINSWQSNYKPGASVYLLENGNLLRTAKLGGGGGIEEIAWDGTVVWFFDYISSEHRRHHDIEPLPNGNVLILAREFKTYSEAIAMGRNPALLDGDELWPEFIVEVNSTGPASGEIVWEWYLWDHLIQDYDSTKLNYGNVADHPELMDINFAKDGKADWIHANSVEYNPDLDQIVISNRHLNEIWIIDHSTTSEEAVGHSGGNSGKGGDILYRWGNPQAYRAGVAADQKMFGQHDAQWIKSGLMGEDNILVFNNGIDRPEGNYSSVEEIISPVDESGHYPPLSPGTAHGPAEQAWIYIAEPPESFFSGNVSGAQRLANGNTLICSGKNGRFFEITPENNIVWEYINPETDVGPVEQGEQIGSGMNSVFRCYRYAADYPGLSGRDLSPGGPIEIYPVRISGTTHFPSTPSTGDSIIMTTTIADSSGIAVAELHFDTGDGFVAISMFDDGNHHDDQQGDGLYGAVMSPVSAAMTVSYYVFAEDGSGSSTYDPPNAPDITYTFNIRDDGYLCGDANGDEAVNIGDAVFVINYVFKNGQPPEPLCAGDANGDGEVNVGDGVYNINHVFKGGPAPDPDCCP
jgi:hypothetical protein